MSDPRSLIRGMVPNSQPMQESVRIDEMLEECGCGCGGNAGGCLAAIGPSSAEVDGQPITGYGEPQQGLPEKLKAFESGDMPQADVVSLFQELVDSGMLGHLGGEYTTTAMKLAQNGLIKVQEDIGIANLPEPAGSTTPGHAPAYTDGGANTDPEHGEDPADIPDAEGSTAAGHGNVDSDPMSVPPKGGYSEATDDFFSQRRAGEDPDFDYDTSSTISGAQDALHGALDQMAKAIRMLESVEAYAADIKEAYSEMREVIIPRLSDELQTRAGQR